MSRLYIVNRVPYAGRIDGSPPARRERGPIRLPPAAPEALLAVLVFDVLAIVVVALLFIAGWIW